MVTWGAGEGTVDGSRKHKGSYSKVVLCDEQVTHDDRATLG